MSFFGNSVVCCSILQIQREPWADEDKESGLCAYTSLQHCQCLFSFPTALTLDVYMCMNSIGHKHTTPQTSFLQSLRVPRIASLFVIESFLLYSVLPSFAFPPPLAIRSPFLSINLFQFPHFHQFVPLVLQFSPTVSLLQFSHRLCLNGQNSCSCSMLYGVASFLAFPFPYWFRPRPFSLRLSSNPLIPFCSPPVFFQFVSPFQFSQRLYLKSEQ